MKLTQKLMLCLSLSLLAACVHQERVAVVNCELYEAMPQISLGADDYSYNLESSIIAKDNKREKLFADEELFKALITTVAKQRLKFKEKGCQIQ